MLIARDTSGRGVFRTTGTGVSAKRGGTFVTVTTAGTWPRRVTRTELLGNREPSSCVVDRTEQPMPQQTARTNGKGPGRDEALMSRIRILGPPFEAVADRADVVDLRRSGHLHRVVLALSVSDPTEWCALKGQLPALRRRLPELPFALLAAGIPASASARLGAQAILAGIRALIGDQVDPDDLQEQLTDRELLPRHQLMWLQQMHIVPRGVCSEVALLLLEEAPRHGTFHGTAKHIRRNPDRLEDLFRDVGAGITPGRLCSLGRWTRTGLELQRSRGSIRDFAKMLGYRNVRSFGMGCRRTFGATPGEVRSWIGFEPLFAAYSTARERSACTNRPISRR